MMDMAKPNEAKPLNASLPEILLTAESWITGALTNEAERTEMEGRILLVLNAQHTTEDDMFTLIAYAHAIHSAAELRRNAGDRDGGQWLHDIAQMFLRMSVDTFAAIVSRNIRADFNGVMN